MATRREQKSEESGTSSKSATTAASTLSPNDEPDRDPKAVLPLLCPPTEEEALSYYSAFPSQPRLIGRTSSGIDPWELKVVEPGPHPEYRRIEKTQIGRHKIRDVWDDIVEPQIVAAVARLPWTSVDIWRIGKSDVERSMRPVVIWVGIATSQATTIPWDDVAQTLRKCRVILDTAGLADVECEMRASDIVPLMENAQPDLVDGNNNHTQTYGSRPQLLDPRDQADLAYIAKPFTTAIGQSVTPLERQGLRGTLCLYLWPAETSPDEPVRIWALTARHVVLPNRLYPGNLPYDVRSLNSSTTTPPSLKLIASPQQKHIESSMNSINNVITSTEKRLQLQEKSGDSDARKKSLRDSKTTAASRHETALLLKESFLSFETASSRTIGHVFLSPPIGVGEGWRFPWTRDWALVELDTRRYPSALTGNLISEVDLRSSDIDNDEERLVSLLNPHPKSQAKFTWPEDGLLRIAGTIPVKEIINPTMLDNNGEECILVGMHGAVTGLSWGKPSELVSTIRDCMPDGGSITTRGPSKAR